MTRTAQSVRNDIASLKAQMEDWSILGWLDGDTERDMLGEIAECETDLAIALDEEENGPRHDWSIWANADTPFAANH